MTTQCIPWEGKEGVSLLYLKEAAQWNSPMGVPAARAQQAGPAWEGAWVLCLTLWLSARWQKWLRDMTEAQDDHWSPVSSLVLRVGLEQLPEVSVGSEQRPLPYFPFLSPSSSFFRPAALRGSFLAAGKAGSAWHSAALLCSLIPRLLPLHPCPSLAAAHPSP